MGNHLSQLLTLLNISGNDLAKGINVDPSVVSRWKNSQRRISSSIYFELISSWLSKNITTTLQQNTIKNMAIELNIPIRCSNSSNMKKCIYDILLAAHKNSFLERSKKKSEKAKPSNNPPIPILQTIFDTNRYPGNIEVIAGHKNVINAGIQLLQSAIEKPCSLPEPIYLTSLTEAYSFSVHEEIHLRLTKVLKKGETVNTLIRLNQNLERNLKIIHDTKKFFTTRRYHPYYVRNYSITSIVPIEFVIVPAVGALVCLGIPGNNQFHCAFLFKDEQSITLLKEIITQAIQHSSPLIEYWEASNPRIRIHPEVAKQERKFGDFFSLKDTLDVMTKPPDLYKKHLLNAKMPAGELEEMLLCQEGRLAHFYKQLRNYKYYTIYKKDAIKNLLASSTYAFAAEVPAEQLYDVIAHLENIVYLLENYEHFQIALADDKNISFLNWSVKDSEAVLMYENKNTTENFGTEELMATIYEPMMVNAYTCCFMDAWDKIAPINKDKQCVISWFKKLIKSIC